MKRIKVLGSVLKRTLADKLSLVLLRLFLLSQQ